MKTWKLWQLLVAVAVLVVGCRTTEIMTTRMVFPKGTDLGKLPAITVNNVMYGCGVDVGQGKVVESSLAASAAASVSAVLRDISAAYGNLTSSDTKGGDDNANAPADSAQKTVQGTGVGSAREVEPGTEAKPDTAASPVGKTEEETGVESPVVEDKTKE